MTVHGILHKTANAVRKGLILTGADRLAANGRLWSKLRPDNSHYPSPTVREAMLDGIRFRLDLSDYMQWSAYFGVERELREKLYGLAAPGNVAIDIGTNIGEVLLNLASRVGPTGRAIGFEPNPDTRERCLQNLALNPGLPAVVHSIALGDAEGELSLGRPCLSNSGGDRIMGDGQGTIPVRVTTLDRFAEAEGIGHVDLIKIDVEGFEMHVLRGGEQVIRRDRPVLFIELSDENLRAQDGSAAELVEWLERQDYSVAHAGNGRPVASTNELGDCFFDIICRPH